MVQMIIQIVIALGFSVNTPDVYSETPETEGNNTEKGIEGDDGLGR